MSLLGIAGAEWWRLLRENRFQVDRMAWRTAGLLTARSVINARFRRAEERRFGEEVARTEVQPPIFVLGHWRSGTTLLHHLLTLDRRFAYGNLFQTSFPHSFLTREEVITQRLAAAPRRERGMDAVQVNFRSPGEDEFALAAMTLRSPQIGWSFPRRAAFYDRFLTFRDAAEVDVEAWKKGLLHLLRKLSFRYGKPLVLKSPPHTARIRLLLEMFPNARFVHIRRDPFAVYQSTRRLYRQSIVPISLQRVDPRKMVDGILHRYRVLYDAYFADRDRVPPGQLHELSFEELEADPVGEVRRVYETLGLPDFAAAEPRLRAYAESAAGYRKTRHPSLSPAAAARVARRWERCFETWGYPTSHPVGG